MPTLQSRWARYNRTPGAHAMRKMSREAASIAGPCPDYPPTAPVHGDWLGGCINGQTVIFRLMRGRGHRCDQWAAEADGEVVPVGEDQCSSLLQFDLGKIGALLMAMSAWRLALLRRKRNL